MAQLKLEIVLDRSSKTYSSAETVTGHVRLQTSPENPCRELDLNWRWKAKNQFQEEFGFGEDLPLQVPAWRPDRPVVEIPFSIPAPGGPFTYHGTRIDVDWDLQAEAFYDDDDLEIHDQVRCTLLPGPQAGGVELSGQKLEPASDPKAPKPSGCSCLIYFLVFGTIFSMFSNSLDQPGTWLILGICLYVVFARLSKSVAIPVEVSLKQLTVTPGQSVPVQLLIHPNKTLQVSQVRVALVLEEIASKKDAVTSEQQVQHVAYRFQQELLSDTKQPKTLKSPLKLQAKLPLPADAAPTFKSGCNHLRWTVQVEVESNQPLWKHEYPIRVWPRPAGASPAPTQQADARSAAPPASFQSENQPTGLGLALDARPKPGSPTDRRTADKGSGDKSSSDKRSASAPSFPQPVVSSFEPPQRPTDLSTQALGFSTESPLQRTSAASKGSLDPTVQDSSASATSTPAFQSPDGAPAAPVREPSASASRPPASANQPLAPASRPSAPDVALAHPASLPPASNPPEKPVEADPAFLELLRQLALPSQFNSARRRLIEGFGSRSVHLELRLQKIEETDGYDAPEALRGGRGWIGQMEGAELPLAIRFPPSRNAEARAATLNSVQTVTAKVHHWDTLRDRLEMEALG